jgi:anti-sigma regulatory factor (Ser/Thr protein kinase)
MPPSGPAAVGMTFDRHSLGRLCTLVRTAALNADISPWYIDDLLIAVSEIATNAICYAGGTGSITLRGLGGGLLVEISDHGPGLPDASMISRATPALAGRGLWLARVLIKEFDLISSPTGVTVRMFAPREGARPRTDATRRTSAVTYPQIAANSRSTT